MIYLYNTLTRKKEEFKPLRKDYAGFYTCGPTVYNFAHIGNLRTYIFEDILKRVLIYNNYQVKHVMNITDVDDKTIRDSQLAGKTLKEFTKYYSEVFLSDIKALNILLPDVMPKATEHIEEIIILIKKLLAKKFAYKVDDGSVYFDISKFKDYGKLARLEKQNLKQDASGRLNSDEYQKDQANDFVLWKAWTQKDSDVYWDSELGKGRPGWHIECSAMSIKHLGESFDIHAGAEDLIFPHHSNEIAQTEAATGKKFVNYWIHAAFLSLDREKMAKSEGNIIALKDIIEKGFNPLAYRYLCLTAHYRAILNFSWTSLQSAQNALDNLYQIISEYPGSGLVIKNYDNNFLNLINDDLDMPKALALVWQMIKDKNISDADKKAALLKWDQVFGLSLDKVRKEKIPAEIAKLAQEREKARQQKDFTQADQLRQQIDVKGWLVEDTEHGPKIRKK